MVVRREGELRQFRGYVSALPRSVVLGPRRERRFGSVVIMVFYSTNTNINLFSLAVAIMVLITHQRNIERLIAREESKVNIFGRKKEN